MAGDTIWCYTTDPKTRWEYCDPIKKENKALEKDSKGTPGDKKPEPKEKNKKCSDKNYWMGSARPKQTVKSCSILCNNNDVCEEIEFHNKNSECWLLKPGCKYVDGEDIDIWDPKDGEKVEDEDDDDDDKEKAKPLTSQKGKGDDEKKEEKKEESKDEKKDEKSEEKKDEKKDNIPYEEGFVAKYYFFKEKTDGKGYDIGDKKPDAEAVTTQINFPNDASFKG